MYRESDIGKSFPLAQSRLYHRPGVLSNPIGAIGYVRMGKPKTAPLAENCRGGI